MSKIQMIRGHRVFNVDARLAPLLERRGGYLRRDMQAQSSAKPVAAKAELDSQALEAKRAAAQAKRVAAAAAKAAPKPAKKAAKKAAGKSPATKAAASKDVSE